MVFSSSRVQNVCSERLHAVLHDDVGAVAPGVALDDARYALQDDTDAAHAKDSGRGGFP